MADIAIETSAHSVLHSAANRGGIFWTSALIGYVIYRNTAVVDGDLVYRKTTDGGATWSASAKIASVADATRLYDCWADWQTPDDTGTKIHIVYLNADEDEVIYRYLDTSTDTVGTRVTVVSYGNGTWNGNSTKAYHCCSITKSRGGKLAIAYRVTNVADDGELEGFYTSPDGSTWASKTSPWESAKDYIQLYCGNETDTDDLWAAFWDTSADEISLKTYDDSGNSWSEQSIASSMAESSTYLQMDGQVRLSDGHLIFAAWDAYTFATTGNLKVWDINGASSITAKTNVLSNVQHYFNVSVFVDQRTDDLYIAYIGGTAILSQVAALYKKSTDGGTAWGDETAMQANAEDDERWVSSGCMKTTAGKFMPVWYNDDLDDIFCNGDNAITISGGYTIVINVGLSLTAEVSRNFDSTRVTSCDVTTTPTITRVFGRHRATTSNLSVSPTVSRSATFTRGTTSNLSLNPVISRAATFTRATTSNLSLATTVTRIRGFFRTITTNLSANPTISRAVTFTRAVTTNLGVSPSVSRTAAYTRATTSNLSLAVTVTRVRNFLRAITVNLSVRAILNVTPGIFRKISTTAGRAIQTFAGRVVQTFTGRGTSEPSGRSVQSPTGRAIQTSSGRTVQTSAGRNVQTSAGRSQQDPAGRTVQDSTGRTIQDDNDASRDTEG